MQQPPAFLAQEQLERLPELVRRLSGSGGLHRGLEIAIDRWLSSKGPRDLADRLIDLRIALEALFLDHSDNAELAFRLATRGAWYLGEGVHERKRISGDLRNVYRAASRVIHAGSPGGDARDQATLHRAQDLCRSAILRMMDESGKLEWGDIIMGATDHPHGT